VVNRDVGIAQNVTAWVTTTNDASLVYETGEANTDKTYELADANLWKTYEEAEATNRRDFEVFASNAYALIAQFGRESRGRMACGVKLRSRSRWSLAFFKIAAFA
jgi:hypothetical protein